MGSFYHLQQFLMTDYAPFKEKMIQGDRRNFEAFIFAKVIHRVLKGVPFIGKRYEARFQKELTAFMDESFPKAPKEPAKAEACKSTILKP